MGDSWDDDYNGWLRNTQDNQITLLRDLYLKRLDMESDNGPQSDRSPIARTWSREELADIAAAAIEELERHGSADFLFLKNDTVREWWSGEKRAREAKRQAELEKLRLDTIKKAARQKYNDFIATLSSEERKLLGVKSKK